MRRGGNRHRYCLSRSRCWSPGRHRRRWRNRRRSNFAPRIGVSGAPLSITLADAIRMTLEQNNDVAIARLDTDVARQNVLVLEGVYDPRVIPNLGYQRTSAPTRRPSAARRRAGSSGRKSTAAWDWPVAPWGGGRYTVDFSGARLDTSNQFARLNPEFPSALTGTYAAARARPKHRSDRRNILVARRAVDLTDAQLDQVVMDQLTLVEEAYWDLAFASGNLVVLTDALAQARGQVASNERQALQGTLAPIDVVEAQTQVSRFQQAVSRTAGADRGGEPAEAADADRPDLACLESAARAG